ncbi:hypothetical protein [Sodalis sp. RH19]|uniref:hypothetical protein n=1 Tax=unclassified Sodalis (in: enterobacteria) TaxID=2636512 RepID=UPI0039B65A29
MMEHNDIGKMPTPGNRATVLTLERMLEDSKENPLDSALVTARPENINTGALLHTLQSGSSQ